MHQTISETNVHNPVILETPAREKTTGEPRYFKWTKKEYHYLAEF